MPRERLLRETNLDLGSALNICRAAENSKLQSRSISHATENQNVSVNLSPDVNVFEIKSSDRPRKPNQRNNFSTHRPKHKVGLGSKSNTSPSPVNTSPGILCKQCGYSHVYGSCPAYRQQCNKCLGYNHFANVCKSKSNNFPSRP